MAQFGSDGNAISQSFVGVTDENGNSIVSTANDFAASPLGVAARAQALFGIANAQFNLLPPDNSAQIEDYENPLPYWSIENLSDGRLTATSVFDTATSTWGVVLDPTAGSANDTLTLKTRSFLLNDDNLSLRQKAFLTLSKSGTAAVSTQWNVVMTAEYFTAADASLTGGTAYAIGTALDTASFTTINGFTTAGTAAIGASAAYVDIKITLTCSANVTGSAKATLKSLLLQSSTGGAGGAQSFIISETFTSSTTWTRPTSVNYLLAVIGHGGGGGGGGGGLVNRDGGTAAGTSLAQGGGSGAGGGFVYTPNIYIGDQTTISVGIGAGGAGGTARSVGSATTDRLELQGGTGGNGGATTFGAYITAGGGGGATGGSAWFKQAVGNINNPGAAPTGQDIRITLGGTTVAYAGQRGGASSGGIVQDGVSSNTGPVLYKIPYASYSLGTGSNGGTGSATGGTAGVAGTVIYDPTFPNTPSAANSGASGPGCMNIGTAAPTVGIGGTAYHPAGAGGAGAGRYFATAGTITVTAGNGGNAGTSSGAGGGGGGPAFRVASTSTVYNNSSGSATSGAGGDGASGWVQIVYVA